MSYPARVEEIAELLDKHAAKIASLDGCRITIACKGPSVQFRLLPADSPLVDERRSLLRRT